jgi:hypothetical protein
MLVVKIELWPGGDERSAKMLGIGKIVNDGRGCEKRGSYYFTLRTVRRVWAIGRVEGFARKSRNAWELLHLCLKAAIEGNNEQNP